MGQEVVCTARWVGKSVRGKALLEAAEILFRGNPRFRIPFSSIRDIAAVDGELRLKTGAGTVVYTQFFQHGLGIDDLPAPLLGALPQLEKQSRFRPAAST